MPNEKADPIRRDGLNDFIENKDSGFNRKYFIW